MNRVTYCCEYCNYAMPGAAELIAERDTLKAEVERLKAPHAKDCAFVLNGNEPGRWDCDCDASELTRERETFLAEHDENVRLHTALEQEREKSEGLRGALEQLRGCARDRKACMEVSSEALLAAKRDWGEGVMKFRKKPAVIDAFNFRHDPCPDWFMDKVTSNEIITQPLSCAIKTLEGTMNAQAGDWIIKGVNGEIYPCKPDIFEKTYEPADQPRSDEGNE